MVDTPDMMGHMMGPGMTRLPIPDPTVLTIQAVEKSITALRELLEMRLAGLERDLQHLQDETNNRRRDIADAVATIKQLQDEKFVGIQEQLSSRDKALDSALYAQKALVDQVNDSAAAAVSKAEAATGKQMDGLAQQLATVVKISDEKINDLRERLSAIDSQIRASHATRSETREIRRDSSNFTFGLVGMVVGLVGFLIAGIVVLQNTLKQPTVIERVERVAPPPVTTPTP